MRVSTDFITKTAGPSSCGALNNFQAVVPAKRHAVQVRNAMSLVGHGAMAQCAHYEPKRWYTLVPSASGTTVNGDVK